MEKSNRGQWQVADIEGKRFGKLVVGSREKRYGYSVWNYTCDCGEKGKTRSIMLTRDVKPMTMCRKCSRSLPRKSLEHKAIRNIYNNYINNCKKVGRSFELTVDEVSEIVHNDCSYCGSEPTITNSRYPYPLNGIDRVDSSQGYNLSNVVTCCTMCNMMKKDLTQEVFLDHVEKINEYRRNK